MSDPISDYFQIDEPQKPELTRRERSIRFAKRILETTGNTSGYVRLYGESLSDAHALAEEFLCSIGELDLTGKFPDSAA